MKKSVSKIISVIMCFAFLMSIPVPAFAYTQFNLTVSKDCDGDLELVWDNPSYAEYYCVYVSTNGSDFTRYTTAYESRCYYYGESGEISFYVKAYDDEHEIGKSNTVSTVCYTSYAENCYAWNDNGINTINWYDYSSRVSGYYIYRSRNGMPFERIADVASKNDDEYTYDDYVGAEPASYKYSVISYQVINGKSYYDENFDEYDECIVYMPDPDMITKSKSQIISWTSVNGAGHYRITADRNAIDGGKSISYVVADLGAGTTSYTVNNVDNIKYEYYYCVEALDYSGNRISKTYGVSSNRGGYRFKAAKKKKNLKTVSVINTRVKKNKVAWKETLSAGDKKILKDFAKKNFKKGWTDAQKAEYTLNWINKNVKYATGKNYDKIAGKSYVSAIFVSKKGQCLQYNGAYAMFLTYLGYEARIIQGWRGTSNKNKISHYWCEMKVDGKWYLMETGNYGKNGSWSFFCEPYASTHYSNTRYIMNNKRA